MSLLTCAFRLTGWQQTSAENTLMSNVKNLLWGAGLLGALGSVPMLALGLGVAGVLVLARRRRTEPYSSAATYARIRAQR